VTLLVISSALSSQASEQHGNQGEDDTNEAEPPAVPWTPSVDGGVIVLVIAQEGTTPEFIAINRTSRWANSFCRIVVAIGSECLIDVQQNKETSNEQRRRSNNEQHKDQPAPEESSLAAGSEKQQEEQKNFSDESCKHNSQ